MKMENDLGRDDIKQLVLRIAIPSMLAQFVSVLYSIVDRMYIGNIAEIGSMALAGVGVCGPILTMVGSVASWVGVGGSPLMSIRMGEGNMPMAKKILANCFLLLCVISVLLMALIIPLRKPMLLLFGASGTTLTYADIYFTTYLMGTPFALLSLGMNQFIISQGFAKIGMKSVILGAAFNIILDPIFIFTLNMGVRGAAIATVISQIASTIYVLRFLLSKRAPVPITFGNYDWKIVGRVLVMGFTPFIIVAIDSAMIIVMNAVLQAYGGAGQGDMLITCATIVQSFMLIVTMPLAGITGGTQTILGYNFGACQMDRVLKAQKYIIFLGLGFTVVMFILARTASPLFIGLFTQDPVLTEMTLWAIKVCTLAIIPLAVQYELVDGFTAMGQVHLALPVSFVRKIIYFIAVFVIPHYFSAEMVFYAEPISDILGPAFTIGLYLLTIKGVLNRRLEAVAQFQNEYPGVGSYKEDASDDNSSQSV